MRPIRHAVPVLWIAACAALAACSTRYADLPMSPTQSIAGAEDALRRGDYETAMQGFSDYLSSGQDTFRARAYYQLAQAQYGLENYEGALDTLTDLESEYPDRNWPQPPALRGDVEYALGHKVEAILAWETAWKRGNEADREFLRPRILAVLDELSPAQSARLAGELNHVDVRAMLATRVSGTLATPDGAGAKAPDEAVGAGEPLPERAGAPAAETAALAPTGGSPDVPDAAGEAVDARARVACLLPLTGRHGAQGQRALSGLRRAFADAPRALIVRDTGGDAGLTAQLVTALADDPNVLAFIGPLEGDAATVVALLAERLQVPVLLLARGDGLTGAYVLQSAPAEDPQTQAYDAAMRVRQAISQGARSRGAVLQHLRSGTVGSVSPP